MKSDWHYCGEGGAGKGGPSLSLKPSEPLVLSLMYGDGACVHQLYIASGRTTSVWSLVCICCCRMQSISCVFIFGAVDGYCAVRSGRCLRVFSACAPVQERVRGIHVLFLFPVFDIESMLSAKLCIITDWYGTFRITQKCPWLFPGSAWTKRSLCLRLEVCDIHVCRKNKSWQVVWRCSLTLQ